MDPMDILLTIDWEQPPEAATLEDYLSFAPEGEARQLFLERQFVPSDLVPETIGKIIERFPIQTVRCEEGPGAYEWAHHFAHSLEADRYTLEHVPHEESTPSGMLFGANIWVTNVPIGILVRLQGEPCQSH